MAIKPFDYSGNTQATSSPVKKAGIKPFSYDTSATPLKPKFSVGTFLKDTAKEVVKLPLRAALNIGASVDTVRGMFGNKEAEEKAKAILERGVDSPTFGNLKPIGNTGKGFASDLKDTFGAGLEAASYIPIARVPTLVGQSLRQTTLQTGKAFAKEGAIAGGVGGAGHEMQNPESTPGSILKAGAIGTGAGTILGGALGGATGAITRAIKPFDYSKVIETPKRLPVSSLAEEATIPVSTPKTKMAKYSKSQGYEPITPTEQLPIIQVGPKATSKLPTIQTQSPVAKGDLTYEPIKDTFKAPITTKETTSVISSKKPPINSPFTKKLPEVRGKETKPTKAALDINSKLVKQGFDELPEEELASFTPITKEEQTAKVSQLIGKDLSKAQAMAAGLEKVPNGIHPQVLFNAVKNKAIQDGNGEILRSLASSPIAKQRSVAAQSLGASGFDNGDMDVIKAITQINKARESKIARTSKDTNVLRKDTIKQANTELKRSKPTKQTVASFIESLRC